jgi:hypothetical protein
MGYHVELESAALTDLSKLDPVLSSLLLDEIERCAVEPTRHSRRPGLPFLPYQRFRDQADVPR